MKIFFDGGCRPNPGEMQVAVVARGVVHHVASLGHGSSEQAEWLALLHGLRVAEATGERDILLLGDAAGVIAQANGAAKCRNADFELISSNFGSKRRRSSAFACATSGAIRTLQELPWTRSVRVSPRPYPGERAGSA